MSEPTRGSTTSAKVLDKDKALDKGRALDKPAVLPRRRDKPGADDSSSERQLVLRMTFHYVSSVDVPSAYSGRPATTESVWTLDEVRDAFKVARRVMIRLFGIEPRAKYNDLGRRPEADLVFETAATDVNDASAAPGELGLDDAHRRFRRIVGSPLDSDRVHVLCLRTIVPEAGGTSYGSILARAGATGANDLGGKLVVIGRTLGKQNMSMAGPRVAAIPINVDNVGTVVAHELGHTLALDHDLTRSHNNVMQFGAQNKKSKKRPDVIIPSAEAVIFPWQRTEARRYGLCMGRFENGKSPAGERCRAFVDEVHARPPPGR